MTLHLEYRKTLEKDMAAIVLWYYFMIAHSAALVNLIILRCEGHSSRQEWALCASSGEGME